jgi:pyrimidine-nucleoside phosphorylase
MRVTELIRKKRDGGEHSAEEIRFLIAGFTRDEIPDYQIAAWLMAAFTRGLSRAEAAALTDAMLHSGRVLDLSHLPAAKVDKHSTGGVGDKTSLVIAPIAAAAGLYVPMISGRGLGHSGGTLDKLESIPGFNVNLSLDEFLRVLKRTGCALIGQTEEIAPADKRLYALRDVTGTVESPALITASIMSKKLAEGIDALVLDVKVGSGAFMKQVADAAQLAELLVETGRGAGKRVAALLTDMEQPLGRNVGNALEVAEAVEVLRGGGPEDLTELCLALAGWMLYLGGRAETAEAGCAEAARLITSGQALEKLRDVVVAQGGDVAAVDDTARLPQARHRAEVGAMFGGYVSGMDAEALGLAAIALGGGREKKEDTVDPTVGLVVHKKIGDNVERDEPLVTLHYSSAVRLEEARGLVLAGYQIGPMPAAPRPVILRTIAEGRAGSRP